MPEIGKFFGFNDCTETDINGKNIFFHLYTSLTYCYASALILKEAFAELAPRLPGNYASAMSQRVTSGQPVGHTPLHVLCDGSSYNCTKLDIIKTLIKNKIVDSELFATLRDNQVTI